MFSDTGKFNYFYSETFNHQFLPIHSVIHSFIIISSSGKISISLGRKVHSLLKRVSVYAQWSKFSPDFIAAVSVLVGKGRIW